MKVMQDLVDLLNRATVAYDDGNPIMIDQQWDKLYFELQEMEQKTGIILENSPTQVIHYESVNELEKVQHNHPMLSLEKTKDVSVVTNFVKDKIFLTMCKMDGLTCSLTYQNGKLVAAETRGNGMVGENILHNAMVIPSIPKRIKYKEELIIDGEIICTYADFEQFQSVYKNPRNFASGSIRLLSSKDCACRNLTFVAWDVLTQMYGDDEIEYRVDQKLDYLETLGFTIVPFYVHNGFLASDKILSVFIEDMKLAAEKKSYPIDGVVIKYADCAYGRSLGSTSHHFKNAIAYKFYDETYSTVLKDVEWTMGRTGTLTPVAIFEPVDIDGSTVERASIHNLSVMYNLFHGAPFVGQKIEVYKANMIIPQILSTEDASDFDDYETLPFVNIPQVCPICGGPVEEVTEIDSTVLVCKNDTCDGKLINILDHFCGKKGLDIKGLSKMTLEKLINWNWISSPIDIFTLGECRKDWIAKPGFGEKSVDKILSAIEDSRLNCDLAQFIAALGIPLIGTSASKELVKHFPTWVDFISAVESDYKFYDISGFGWEMHSALKNFDYTKAKFIVNNFISFNSITTNNNTKDTSLDGLVFVITGKVTKFKNRDELKMTIESLGGKVTGSVSKNTNYLINNDVTSTSSKNKTAQSLGIPIISEETFIETFGLI